MPNNSYSVYDSFTPKLNTLMNIIGYKKKPSAIQLALRDLDIESEYELIKQKKSKLSANVRRVIVEMVEEN